MASRSQSTKLDIRRREAQSSRESRRLRRNGRVPGVLYGRGLEVIPFEADERELRHALQAAGAVLDLSIDGEPGEPAVLKDAQRHPVRGELVHIDLLRVDLNKPIQQPVPVHLAGQEDAPGVKEGGVLEHVSREVNVEALPAVIPEFLELDVSAMDINDTLTLAAITPPEGVTLLDDPEETVIATLTPPRLQLEEEETEIEEETELVGEGAGEAEGEPDDAGAEEVPADAGDKPGGE